jgi:hypothetical protein
MQNKCLEIFGLKLYKINSKNIIKSTGDIYNICEIYTKENKGYHIKLFNKDNVILFGDVDHINNKSIFKEILNALSDFFNIDMDDISYTVSKKLDEYSYHWSFNGFYTTVENLKKYMLSFKKSYPQFDKYIDLIVYSNNWWFRLPFQTNDDKPHEHKIKKGEPSEFVINYIPENCKLLIKYISDECQLVLKKIDNNDDTITNIDDNNIENLLKCLLPARCDNYDDWIKIGFIINNEMGINGLNIFDKWSQLSSKYDSEKVKTFYNNIKPKENGLKIGTLKKMAKNDNPKLYKKLTTKIIINEELEEQSKDSYNLIKNKFEETNFKIINPIMFITIDKNNKIIIRNKKDFKDVYENLLYEKLVDNELVNVSFINDWLKDPKMRTYNNFDFLPNNTNVSEDVYNTFDKYEAEKTELINNDIENSLIIKHIKNLCNNNDDVFNYVINFLSRKIKQPSKLTNTALIFKSNEGVGKDLFFNWFGNKILGNEYFLNTEKAELLFGKFTSSLENKILIIVNETSGKDTFNINENIKNGITTEFNIIEHKGLKPYKNTNHIGYIFLTNNDNPLKVGVDDRRFCGIECNNKICNNKDYFTALKKEMDSKKYDRAFYEYLLTIDSNEYDFTNNRPKTEFYSDLQELNKPALINFIENVIMDSMKKNKNNKIIEISSSLLYTQYNEYITNFNFKNSITITKFILDVKKINGVTQKRTATSRNIIFDILETKKYLIEKYKIDFFDKIETKNEIESDSDDDDTINPLDKI